MKRILFIVVLLSAFAFTWAMPVSISKAHLIAENFAISRNIPFKGNSLVNVAPEGMFHQLYVFGFRDAEGFIIVAADDRVLPILGYSYSTRFSPADMPKHVSEWLSDYEAQIDSLVAHNVEPTALVQREWNVLENPDGALTKSMSTVVGPLISTTWNQSPLYNSKCPAVGRERTVTGCVATATAQIMKYWNHPATGHGSHSYEWNGQTLSADFGNTNYDWANMPNSLDATSTSAQIDAVATLMYHAGVAVEMKYDVSSNGGSSAYNISQIDLRPSSELALQAFFKYSNSIRDVRYADVTDAQWKAILKNELNNNRVVLYDGRDESGGHSFVCDGYDASDYFHFNWGWGGTYDGFYAIGDLHPGTGGIGGNSSYTFNIDNSAVIGIQPINGNIPASTIVSVSSNNAAYGNVSGAGSYNAFDTIQLLATAADNYIFDHWDDGDISNPRFMFATSANINRTAYFDALPTDTLYYCGNEMHSAYGNSQSVSTSNWGIRYPASALASNRMLTKVQLMLYEYGQYQLKIYQGDSAQMSLVYSEPFYNSYRMEWVDLNLSTPYVIDNSRSLWITLEYTGSGYPLAYSVRYGGNSNSMMLLNGKNWDSYDNYGIYGSWLIKGITEENTNPGGQYVTLTANASPADGGSVNPGFSYVAQGTDVQVTAEAASNYRFVNWDDGSTDYSRTVTVNSNQTITAEFEPIIDGDTVGYCVHDFANGIGMSGGGTIYWAVKFETGSPLTNRILKAISYYNYWTENTHTVNAYIYSGGYSSPQNYLEGFSFTPSATAGWQTFQLPTPVNCGNDIIWIILGISDASLYPCTYTSYSANPNGSYISIDNGSTFENVLDYGIDATWMIRAIVEDQPTIEVVCNSYESEFYNEFYEWNNDCWVQLYNDDYTFNFNVLCNAGETNIANGQTYTISDMVPGYTWGRDNYTWNYMDFASASLVRRGNSYEAYVTTTDNIKYHITYNAPESITQIKDTVSITINNRNTCSIANSIETTSYFQLVGSDVNDEYMLYFCIKNTSSIAGTYTIDDVYSLYTGLLHGDDIIQCNSLLPNAVVTAGQTENSYNAVIHFLGSDSVLYEITYEYSDPVSATQVTYNANNLVVTKDADYYDYLDNYGLYAYDFEANNGTEILRGIVLNTNDNAFGTYSYNDGYINIGIYDALTEEMVNNNIFSGSLTISQNETGITLTGSALTHGDIEYTFNVTGEVPVPDTFDIVCTNLQTQYYSEDNDVYILLTDGENYSFAFDIYCNGNSHDIVDGQAYTMADMLEEFSMGYNGNREEYIYYSSCTFTRNSHGDVSALVAATTGEVYRITYTALRPVDTVQVVVTDNLSKIRLVDLVSNSGIFQFYGPSNDGLYTAYCAFTGVTSLVGTHPASEIYSDFTKLYDINEQLIPFNRMVGDAVVALNGNVYTLEMNYVSTDAILYHVTIQYHEPLALTQETINATNLEIQDADWDENMFTVQCSNSEYLFYAEVGKTNTSYDGSYSADEMNAWIYDANTYDLLYYGYTPNITISTINGQQTMTGTLLCYGDIQFNINASHTVDTTYIVANEVDATDYTSDIGFCYVQLIDDERCFTFAVNGVSDLTNGHTYTLADMNSGYSYCRNLNDYNIEFSYLNCTLTRNSAGDYHAEVTATNGDVYIIDYIVPRPIFEFTDTVQVVVTDNLSKIRLVDLVSNSGIFQFIGPSNDGLYTASCAFTGVTSLVGTHPASEIYSNFTILYDINGQLIPFNRMVGDAVVTLNGNVYNFTMNYVGADSVLYQITIQYHEPQALTQETITATNLEIKDADEDENIFTVQCSNSEYLFYAEVGKTNTSYDGSYSANEMSAWIYDANTYDLLYYGYTPNITISTINGQQTMTGTLLCYGDILFNINAVKLPDTTYVVCDNVAESYFAEDNDLYVRLYNNDYNFYFDVYCDAGSQDINNGQIYTLANMIEQYSIGVDINAAENINYSSCTLTRNSYGDYHAEVLSTTDVLYVIDYVAPRPDAPSYFFTDTVSICQGTSYIWHGRTLSAAGVYYDSLQTTSGSDSIYQLTLDVSPTYFFNHAASICQGTSFNWHGRTLSDAGVYYDSLQTTSGCDSIYQLTLDVSPTYFFNHAASICQGTSFNWRGRTLSDAGVYYDSLQTTSGCDSIYQLTLDVSPSYFFNDAASICQGTSFNWRGRTLSDAGVYYDSLQTTSGCDSIYQLTLEVSPTYFFNHAASICQGTSFNWRGRTLSDAGVYYDSLQTTSGCDSIYQLTLDVSPTYFYNHAASICQGTSFNWRGRTLSDAGVYYDSLQTTSGCDSIYQLTLEVNLAVTKDTLYITMDSKDNKFVDLISDQQAFHIIGSDRNNEYQLKLAITNANAIAGRYTTKDVVSAMTSLSHIIDRDTVDIDFMALSPNAVFIGTADNFTATINYMSSDSSLYVIDFIYKAESTSIANPEVVDYVAYTEGTTIVLHGAQNETIALYDMAGRLISSKIADAEYVRIEAPVAGIYMLYVNGHTLRVVVK